MGGGGRWGGGGGGGQGGIKEVPEVYGAHDAAVTNDAAITRKIWPAVERVCLKFIDLAVGLRHL